MNKKTIEYGFMAAAAANISGVLLFSRFFTNEVLNNTDPVVMSNFGLVMIIVWGLAYLSVAKVYEHTNFLLSEVAKKPYFENLFDDIQNL